MTDKSQSRAELEQRVEQLETTVSKMLPGRRAVLKGGAVAGAGLLGFGAGQASAQEGSGSIGTAENPVANVYTDTLTASMEAGNFDSLTTEGAVIGVDPSGGGDGIQAAIDALPSEGGIVDLRRGVYETASDDIRITRDDVYIRGDGMGASVIRLEDGSVSDPEFGIIEIDAPSAQERFNITLSDFTIDGNRGNVSGTNANSEGIETGSPISNEAKNITIQNVEVFGISGGDAIDVDSSGEDHLISNCYVHDCDKDGIHISGGNNNRIIGNTVFACGGRGFTNVNSAQNNVFIGNVAKNNTGGNYVLEDSCIANNNQSFGGGVGNDDFSGAGGSLRGDALDVDQGHLTNGITTVLGHGDSLKRAAELITAHTFQSPSNGNEWIDIVEFEHHGGSNNILHGVSNVVARRESNGGLIVQEVNETFSTGNQGSNWGSDGATYSVSTNARFEVQSDTSKLRYQVNIDDDFANICVWLLVGGKWGDDGTTVLV